MPGLKHIASAAAFAALSSMATTNPAAAMPVAKAPTAAATSSVTHIHWRRGCCGPRFYRPFYRPYFFPVYGAYGYGPDGCGWLHRRAVITGSRYWWSRFHACEAW